MVAASGWKNALTEATLTIAPLPFLTISVRAARLARSAIKKFICIAQAKSSSLVPKNPSVRIRTAPTLLTSTSMRPCCSVACRISWAGPSGAVRSTATGVTPLSPSRVSVVSEPATTCAPSPARARVVAIPMPLPAPVTTATLPARFRSMSAPSVGPASRTCRSCLGWLRAGEALGEREGRVSDLAPAAVDGERVPAAGHLDHLGHAGVALLVLVGGAGDRRRRGVVFLAGDEQHRAAVGVAGVDLRLGPRVEVGGCALEQGPSRRGHREGLVELLGFVLGHDVGEGVPELVVGQRHCPVAVGRVAQSRTGYPQRRDRERQDAAERCRVDRHACRCQPAAGQDLCQQPAEGVTDDNWLGGQ